MAFRVLLAVLFGVLEGVTEWLPVSSTGHLILLRHFVSFPVRPAFFELFEVVVQLGAILAVVALFFTRLNPFSRKKTGEERRATWRLWGLIFLAAAPSALVGFLADDLLEEKLYNAPVVAAALIFYGVLFLLVEYRWGKTPRRRSDGITPARAFGVGLFQVLALVPGTSRSGATVLGGLCLGLSRTAAAEFSFFLGIPTMAGASGLKAVKFFLAGDTLTCEEVVLLAAGTLTAFLVSITTIRALLGFVRRHSFAAFGVYRILLGVSVLLTLLI